MYLKAHSKRILVLVYFLLSFANLGIGQTYGLYFSGPEVSKDLRTGLNLSTYKSYTYQSDFVVSFDLMFGTFENRHFGFVSRFISEKQQNMDLVYDNREGENKLVLVTPNNLTEIPLSIEEFENKWLSIEFIFKKKTDEVKVVVNQKSVSVENIGFSTSSTIDISFGAVKEGIYKTSDVPSMNIKNISIQQNQKENYRWLLNETEGDFANDNYNKVKARVYNPVWLTQKHFNWNELASFTVDGRVGAGYDNENEIVLVCSEKLIRFRIDNLGTTEEHFTNKIEIPLAAAVNVVVNNEDGNLVLVSLEDRDILTYSMEDRKWGQLPQKIISEQYNHQNTFYSRQNNKLLFFGGLWNNTYQNNLFEFDFGTKTWNEYLGQNDRITPRYLSAFGMDAKEENLYILGGYGSKSGDPIQNAHYLNELYCFNLSDRKLNKVAEYEGLDDFAFANSLIFDRTGENFYALKFSSQQFNSNLQLVEGNLKSNKLVDVGNTIPFLFQTRRSFADLYYSKKLNQLIAITGYFDNNEISHVRIFSIYSPPNKAQSIIQDEIDKRKAWYWIILILSFDVVLFLGFLINKKIRKKNLGRKKAKELVKRKELEQQLREQAEGERPRSSVFLFGGFQVFDRNSKDVSKLFTPLVKELFLIILLYPIKNGKGISADKLIELLWFDKSPKKAVNNRAVNLGKLKKILETVGSYQLSNKNGYYTLTFNAGSPKVYVDILEFKMLIQQEELELNDLIRLLQIIQKGTILSFMNNEWLDDIKERIASQVIDTLTEQLQIHQAGSNLNLISNITDSILIFDPLNENAISEKCKLLINRGEHGVAKKVFQKFVSDYETLYDSPYDKTLKSIIE